MSYIVRDDNGRLILKLSNSQANDIMNGIPGHFREYQSVGGTKKTAFQLDDDRTIEFRGLTVYLWKGSVFIPWEN